MTNVANFKKKRFKKKRWMRENYCKIYLQVIMYRDDSTETDQEKIS